MRLRASNSVVGKKFHRRRNLGFSITLCPDDANLRLGGAAVGQEKTRDNRAFRAESAGKSAAPLAFQRQPPEMTMHTGAPALKVGGRLSREDQRRLGDILQRVYDDVVRQGVPDRFKDLLGELDRLEDDPGQPGPGKSEASHDAEADSVVSVRGLGDSKGSHR
jgi:hypothetical protein